MFRGLPTFANAAGKSPAPAVPTPPRAASPVLPPARVVLPHPAVANNLLAAAGPAADPRTMMTGSAFPAFVSRSAPPVTQYVPVRSTPGHLNNLAQALTGPPQPQPPVASGGLLPRPALPRAGSPLPSAPAPAPDRGAVPARFGSRPLATPKKSPPLLESNRQGSLLGQPTPPSAESMRQGAVMNAVRLAMRQAMRARLTPVQTPRPPAAQPPAPQPQPAAQRPSGGQRPPLVAQAPLRAVPQEAKSPPAPATPPALAPRPAAPARPGPAHAEPPPAPAPPAPTPAARATTPSPPVPPTSRASAAAPAAPTPAKSLPAAEPSAAAPVAPKPAACAAAPAGPGERSGPVREPAGPAPRANVSLAPMEVSPGSRDKSAAPKDPCEPVRPVAGAGSEAPRLTAPVRTEREMTADVGRQQHAGVRPAGVEQRPVVEWARAQASESLSSSGFGGGSGGGGGGGGGAGRGRRERRQEEEQGQEGDGLSAVRLAPSRLADAGTNVGLDWLGGDPELGLRHSAQAREAAAQGRVPWRTEAPAEKPVPQRRWDDEPRDREYCPPRIEPRPLQEGESPLRGDLLEAGLVCACCGSFLGQLRQQECPRCREESGRAMRALAADFAAFSIWLWTTCDPRPVRCTRGFRLTDFRALPSASFR